jgi:hypothetical protein
MPEINNSLALGVKSDPVDLMGTLGKAAAFRESQAKTNILEQSYGEREREYGENSGLTAGQRATMSKTQQEAMGPIGNILSNDQSLPARQQALSLAKRAGIPMDTMTEQHLLTAPADQIKQYGVNAQRLGQASTTNIEQSPPAIAARAQSHAGGSELGTMYGPSGGVPSPSRTAPPVAAPKAPGAPAVTPESPGPQNLSLMERKAEAAANAVNRAQEFKGYQTEADAAGEKKVALRQIMADADRIRTGKGQTKINDAKKWVQTAATIVPGLDKLVNVNDSVAAFESLEKNRGIVARAAMKGVGGTAASELEAISGSLASGETSNKGIDVNVSQLIGLENAKKARFNAAQEYQDRNGSLKGFAADFNKNAGPAAWVYMSLPPEERQSIKETLQKTKQGQGVIQSIARQIHYIHTNKLDEGID